MASMSFAAARTLLTTCGAVMVDADHMGSVIDQGDAITVAWNDIFGTSHIATFTGAAQFDGSTNEIRLRSDDHDIVVWLLASVENAIDLAAVA